MEILIRKGFHQAWIVLVVIKMMELGGSFQGAYNRIKMAAKSKYAKTKYADTEVTEP
jgi:hypothetical protein